MSNYELWQLDAYGNVLSPVEVMPAGECENKEEELQRFSEWSQLQADIELEKAEYYESYYERH